MKMNTTLTLATSSLMLASSVFGASVEERLAALEERLGAYESRFGKLEASGSAASIDASFGDSARGGIRWSDKTSLGGYGELHLNVGEKDQIDFHRYVLFVNHEFNDRVRLFSELELEHSLAGEGEPGEVELEQAYIEYDINDAFTARAGLFLLPIGILNETHEPDTFFGVERNIVEAEIIPTTWWEGGVGVTAKTNAGLQFDLAVTSGLSGIGASSGNAFRIRSGRQKVAEFSDPTWAVTGRVKYTGIEGLELAASVHYADDIGGVTVDEASALLTEGHFIYKRGGFGLKGLYAFWHIDDPTADISGADHQWGGYIEPSYTFDFEEAGKLGVFARYTKLDGVRAKDQTEYSTGLNYWPVDNVVLKADYQRIEENDGASKEDQFNFGIGYSF